MPKTRKDASSPVSDSDIAVAENQPESPPKPPPPPPSVASELKTPYGKFFPTTERMQKPPAKFFDRWREIWDDPELRPRLMIYVYQIYPIIDTRQTETPEQRMRHARQLTQVFKLPAEEEPWTFEDFCKRAGYGSYRLKLNDQGLKGTQQTWTEAVFDQQYGINDWEKYPPAFDQRWLILDDPRNAPYIRMLRNRGMLPTGGQIGELEDEEEEMANTQTQSMKETVDILAGANEKLIDRVISMGEKQAAPVPASPPMAEQTGKVDVSDVINRNADALSKAHDMCMDMVAKANKPVESMREVVTLLKELIPPPAAPVAVSDNSAIYREMLEQQRNHTKDMLELIGKQQAAANPPASNGAAAGKTGLSSVIEELKGLNELKELLGVSGEEGVAAAPKGFTGALLNGLQSMLTSMGPQVGNLLMGYFQSRAVESRAREVAAYNAAIAQGGKPGDLIPPGSLSAAPAAPVQQPQPVQNSQQQPNAGVQMTPEMIEAEERATIAKVKPLFTKYLLSGQSGSDFAGVLLDMMELLPKAPGSMPPSTQLDLICAQGVENLRASLVKDADLAKLYQSKPAQFDNFLDEFVRHGEIWDKEGAE